MAMQTDFKECRRQVLVSIALVIEGVVTQHRFDRTVLSLDGAISLRVLRRTPCFGDALKLPEFVNQF